MKTAIVLTLATAAALGTLPSFGQLPGLPVPAPATTDVRGNEPAHAPVMTQTGPIRGSLFKQGAAAIAPGGVDSQGVVIASHTPVSFIAVEAPQPKRYHKNDLVTIVIREDSATKTNGQSNAKKTQDFDLALQQFLNIALASSGVPYLTNSSNPSQLPEVKFKYSNDRKSDAQQDREDSFSARLTAKVVDVKPNGTMIVEAVKEIHTDKEVQIFTLSGVCRVEDIASDNTLLSTQLADLSLSKQTKGDIRDATKRGWLNKIWDNISPF